MPTNWLGTGKLNFQRGACVTQNCHHIDWHSWRNQY